MTNQKKIAVVTGSNRGLGYAIARKLSQIGIHVVLTSRNQTDGLAVKESFELPKNSPDLNCRDISQRRLKVLPPDPHGFDRDGDGIGCER
ncbi:SDR family NAD(P)-dependent oxidoreductase [Nostoc sp. UIC 10890]